MTRLLQRIFKFCIAISNLIVSNAMVVRLYFGIVNLRVLAILIDFPFDF